MPATIRPITITEIRDIISKSTKHGIGPDFSRRDFSGLDLSEEKIVLDNGNFEGAVFHNTNLTGVSMIGAYLNNTDMTGAILTQTNCVGAHFINTILDNAIFEGTNVRSTNVKNIRTQGAQFYDLQSDTLTGGELISAAKNYRIEQQRIAEQMLIETRIQVIKDVIAKSCQKGEGPNFRNWDFSNLDLSQTGMELDNGNFEGAIFRNTNLTGVSMAGAWFKGAIMDNANLTRTNCGGAHFINTSLRNAILDGTILSSANVQSVDTAGAMLTNIVTDAMTTITGRALKLAISESQAYLGAIR